MIKKSLCLFIVSCLLLVLSLECFGETLSPAMLSQKKITAQKLSAVDRLDILAKEMQLKRKGDGLTDLGAASLLTFIEYILIENNKGKYQTSGFWISILASPIIITATLHYLSKGVFFIAAPTSIEQDNSKMKKLSFGKGVDKEEYASDILKENSNKEQEVRWAAFHYKDIQFVFPKLHGDITNRNIKKSYLEYLEEKQALK